MNEQDESLTMEGLKESLGVSEPAAPAEPVEPAEAPTETPGEETPAPPAEGQQTETPQPEAANKQGQQELPLERLNKEAHTFAAMRKTISEQQKVLTDIGKSLGITGEPSEILQGLKNITNAQKAKDAGVPPEIMERLTALEQEKAQREIQDRNIQTYAAISNFQRELGIDKRELQSFLIQLAKSGKNPFEQQVDLKAEYLVMNFDKLQQQAVQKALEQQARLDTKASTQSTNPGTRTGGGVQKTTEIKTYDDLDAFLKANIK